MKISKSIVKNMYLLLTVCVYNSSETTKNETVYPRGENVF